MQRYSLRQGKMRPAPEGKYVLYEDMESLKAVMDAADAFLAEPPADMPDSMPFHQYTTAGDCRALVKAYAEAAKGGSE